MRSLLALAALSALALPARAKKPKPEEAAGAPAASAQAEVEAPPAEQGAGPEEPSGLRGMPAGPFTFGTLLQTRFAGTIAGTGTAEDKAAAGTADGWLFRRARLRVYADPSRKIHAELDVDFTLAGETIGKVGDATGSPLRDALVTLRPWSWLDIHVGQFKKPFSAIELRSPAKLEIAERGPTAALAKQTGFAGRDLGAIVAVRPLPEPAFLELSAGAFKGGAIGSAGGVEVSNAAGAEGAEASPWGVLVGRATSEALGPVRLGAGVAWRPSATGQRTISTSNDISAGKAYSADVRAAFAGLRLYGEVTRGDRTDLSLRGTARTFLGATALATYTWRPGGIAWMQLVPAAKYEWFDADRQDAAHGRRQVATAAINVDIRPNVRLLLEAERTFVQQGTANVGFPSSNSSDIDTTLLLGQLQVGI